MDYWVCRAKQAKSEGGMGVSNLCFSACHVLAINCRWILEISPSGSSNLLSSLKAIFESGTIFEDCDKGKQLVCHQLVLKHMTHKIGAYEIEESAGIYLVMSSIPDQPIVSYQEGKRRLALH